VAESFYGVAPGETCANFSQKQIRYSHFLINVVVTENPYNATQFFWHHHKSNRDHRCVTLAAPAVHPEAYYSDPDIEEVNRYYAQAIYKAVGHSFAISRFATFNLPKTNLLATPGVFEDLDFTCGALVPPIRTISFRILRDSVCNGFVLWVQLHVDDQNIVDTWSGTSWAPVFLDAQAFDVRRDDEIAVECRIEVSANGINPNYELACTVRRNQRQIHHMTISSPYIGAPTGKHHGVE
jgi:type I protein arginine methyltransferase